MVRGEDGMTERGIRTLKQLVTKIKTAGKKKQSLSKEERDFIETCNIKLDKIIFLLETLTQSQSFGVALKYPDGEPLQAKGLIEKCAERAELLCRRGGFRKT